MVRRSRSVAASPSASPVASGAPRPSGNDRTECANPPFDRSAVSSGLSARRSPSLVASCDQTNVRRPPGGEQADRTPRHHPTCRAAESRGGLVELDVRLRHGDELRVDAVHVQVLHLVPLVVGLEVHEDAVGAALGAAV
eukprot:1648558-Prymnesium_polylepis.1